MIGNAMANRKIGIANRNKYNGDSGNRTYFCSTRP